MTPDKNTLVGRLLDRSDHYLPDWARSAMDEAAAEIERLTKRYDDDLWAGAMWAHLNHVSAKDVDTCVDGFMSSVVDGCLRSEKEHRLFIRRQLSQTVKGLFARALTAESSLSEAVKALEPFALAEQDIGEGVPDDWDIWESPAAINIKVGDLRRASTIRARAAGDSDKDRHEANHGS